LLNTNSYFFIWLLWQLHTDIFFYYIAAFVFFTKWNVQG